MDSERAAPSGLRWRENGQVVLSGALLSATRRIDETLAAWAAGLGAAEYRFPALLPASELAKVDYFRSFPHLATFPVALEGSAENLRRFADAPTGEGGDLRLAGLAPVREVLTPAACYHFYVELAGRTLDRAALLTTVATCFRREAEYAPLRRQWSFTMREVVCVGTREEVDDFLEASRRTVAGYFDRVGLPIRWENSTDPFFDASHNPKFLAQRLDPVKTEMLFGDLSIGSVNSHRNFFGESFGIGRGNEPAFSGCVAFGIERWLSALLARFGEDPEKWPAALWSLP